MSLAVSLALLALAISLCLAGMVLLAFSLNRNWRDVGMKTPVWPRARMVGWGLVFASLAATIARDGPSFAALIWPMLIAGAAILIGMVLAYRPAWPGAVARRLPAPAQAGD
ncbi:MAG: DUF3325 domain-containing protein [Pseudomonadota bacterium]